MERSGAHSWTPFRVTAKNSMSQPCLAEAQLRSRGQARFRRLSIWRNTGYATLAKLKAEVSCGQHRETNWERYQGTIPVHAFFCGCTTLQLQHLPVFLGGARLRLTVLDASGCLALPGYRNPNVHPEKNSAAGCGIHLTAPLRGKPSGNLQRRDTDVGSCRTR